VFLHRLRNDRGALLATLRYETAGESTGRFELLDAGGAVVLAAEVGSLATTRILDGAKQDIPCGADTVAHLPEPAIRLIGSSTVMRSCQLAGHPVWILEDYENQTRHLIFGWTEDLFLHAHLDACGTVTVVEKTREHATLRTVRRSATGALLADEAVVQPGEEVDDLARRCGLSTDDLLATNGELRDGAPLAGTIVPLA
jgi:hypothetical protein